MPLRRLGPSLLMAAFLFFLFAFPAHADYELSGGRVKLLYHFNGDSTDSSGNGRNGSSTGVTYGANYGKLGQGVEFRTATSSRIESTSGTIGIIGQAARSVCVWINVTSTMAANKVASIAYWGLEQGGVHNDGYVLSTNSYGGNFGNTWFGAEQKNGATSVGTGAWTFLCETFSTADNKIHLYVNGVEDGTGTAVDGARYTTSTLVRIGYPYYLPDGDRIYFGGNMDELVIADETFSTSTISAMYNSGAGHEICVTLGCATAVYLTSSTQYKADAVTQIPEGATTTEQTVVVKATLHSSSINQVQLQVEARPFSTAFSNIATATSSLVNPEAVASATLSLGYGLYHWQARVLDPTTSSTSNWAEFGTASNIDFEVTPAPFEIVDGSIKAYYHFNGTSTDSSGNGLHGSSSSNMTYPVASAKLGSAGASFNGTTSGIDTSGTIGIIGQAARSVCVWVNVSSTMPANKVAGLVFWGLEQGGVHNDGYVLSTNSYSGNFGNTWLGAEQRNGATSIGNNTSTYLCATFSTTDSKVHLYVNGVEDGTGTTVNSARSTTNTVLHIGEPYYMPDGDRIHFGGSMDELVVASKAFSLAEIQALYNSGTAREICLTGGCGVTELSGTISASTTWTRAGSPYVVTSTVTINSGVKVTVEPSVIIKFKDGKDLVVNGELDVRGTSSSLTYFTSYKDDAIGGDTNKNGTATNATTSDWGHVKISSGASTTLAGAVVRYGGGNASSSANIFNDGGTLSLSFSDVSSSSYDGLVINSGTTTISNSVIRNNQVAVDIDAGGATITSSFIFNNYYGVLQASAPTSTMTNNFWGGWMPTDLPTSTTFNSGPYSLTNASGVGDDVSANIAYGPYVLAYLSDPSLTSWSPPGVSKAPTTYRMRVGSSTQYQSQLVDGMDRWNASSSGYVTITDASSATSSEWDIYVADVDLPLEVYAGVWITAGGPHVLFNSDKMNPLSTSSRQCVTTHELGHALGLAHAPPFSDNIMRSDGPCPAPTLGTQDVADLNLLWSPVYFWDPHRVKGLVTQ